jgi:hypothetical protein
MFYAFEWAVGARESVHACISGTVQVGVDTHLSTGRQDSDRACRSRPDRCCLEEAEVQRSIQQRYRHPFRCPHGQNPFKKAASERRERLPQDALHERVAPTPLLRVPLGSFVPAELTSFSVQGRMHTHVWRRREHQLVK